MRAMVAIALLVLVATGSASAAEDEPAAGWYYLWSLCAQEVVEGQPSGICEVSHEEDAGIGIAVSNAIYLPSDIDDPLEVFASAATPALGYRPEPNLVGPYPSWQGLEQDMAASLRFSRQLEQGKISLAAIPLDPARLSEEPNDEEAMRDPPPLPPLMAVWSNPDARLEQGEGTCGLFTAEGDEVLPALLHDAWDGDGFSCPSQLHEDYGIYAFHVRRSGAVCGDDQTCTELFDADGNFIAVLEHSPEPVFSVDLFRRFGLIAAGNRQQGLYSIAERQMLTGRLPFAGLADGDAVHITYGVIADDRLAVSFERQRATGGEPEQALFFLDTRSFESAWTDGAPPACPGAPETSMCGEF